MRCFNCMNELKKDSKYCPYCGRETRMSNPPHHLAAGTLLNNRYLIGNTIGEGGFGITYVGLDTNIDLKIAIKEYFPSGYATRFSAYSNEVTITHKGENDFFIHGKERFLNEAKNIAKFHNESGIVDVRDYFTGNNTAYIVMEYLEGETLAKTIHDNGVFAPEELFRLMLPLMGSLKKMHAKDIIHRDISPDNIMYMNSGGLKLMDFGSARHFSADESKTMSILLKPGYAPYEQYSRKGNQGPWTDVYGLCATIYKCITGVTPPDSLDRLRSDTLKKPSELGVRISPALENALLYGMEIYPSNRCQSMSELADKTTAALSELPKKPVETDKEITLPADEKIGIINTDSSVKTDKYKTIAAYPPPQPPETPKSPQNEPQKNELQKKYHKKKNEKEPPKKRGKKALVISVVAVVLVAAIGIGIFFGLKSSSELKLRDSLAQTISAGGKEYTVGLRSIGTVVATGYTGYSFNVSDWKDIVSISSGYYHTVGLKSDGTVVTTGRNFEGQSDVSDWKDIIAVSAESFHTVGLKSDGTVVATGDNSDGQCNVSNWKDIVSISTGYYHTVGLKSDGTAVATSDNEFGICNVVSNWKDIVAVSAGTSHIVGLKSDGTVVATGNNNFDQCDVEDWKDIVAISAGYRYTIGLKSDGTVVATGDNSHGQCNVDNWEDIVAISAGYDHTVGLKSDGTVVATGNNEYGQCNVSDLKDIKLPAGK